MLARVASEALTGLEGHAVEVEADVVAAAPSFSIVGLPDTAVQESRERVRAAIVNSSFEFPSRRITINLAPADVRKEGPSFDLPIALAFLIATRQARVANGAASSLAAVGELGLDGSLRPVSGALALAESARRRGLTALLVPIENAAEAALVGELRVYPVKTLREAVSVLEGAHAEPAQPVEAASLLAACEAGGDDLADVAGQERMKRVLEIAAAGSHNLLMVGPPGSGKTMLARRLPSILPPLTVAEAIDVTRVHSVAGLLPAGVPLVVRRPFRAPHHSISSVGLVGGGTTPRPGEVSLSHLGVLFLDEFPEFRLSALEGLRQPLEDGQVTISRALTTVTYPARIMLVAAMNPCPCGFRGDLLRDCVCPAHRLRQYHGRLSGPLVDRIDLRVEVPRLTPRARRTLMEGGAPGEPSAVVRARIVAARERQLARLVGTGAFANAHMSARDLRRSVVIETEGAALLDRAYDRLRLSARACDRIVKVAQTIADLAAAPTVTGEHIKESLMYRAPIGGEA